MPWPHSTPPCEMDTVLSDAQILTNTVYVPLPRPSWNFRGTMDMPRFTQRLACISQNACTVEHPNMDICLGPRICREVVLLWLLVCPLLIGLSSFRVSFIEYQALFNICGTSENEPSYVLKYQSCIQTIKPNSCTSGVQWKVWSTWSSYMRGGGRWGRVPHSKCFSSIQFYQGGVVKCGIYLCPSTTWTLLLKYIFVQASDYALPYWKKPFYFPHQQICAVIQHS